MANDKKFIVKNGLSAQNIDFVDNNFVKVITLNTDANTAVFSDSVDDILRVGGVSADGTVLEFNDATGSPVIRIKNEDVSITPTSGRLLIGSIDNPNNVDRVQVSGSLSSTILKTNSIQPTTPGSEDYFLSKVWVNFNGSGTVTIRGDGNVTSITDNGAGDYTANFTVAAVDANYALAGSCVVAPTSPESVSVRGCVTPVSTTYISSAARFFTSYGTSSTQAGDFSIVSISVLR